MHYHVTKYDASKYARPAAYDGHAQGFDRLSLINRATGSVHAEACMSRLQAGGSIDTAVHAYEKGIYVFEGAIELLRAGEHIRLPTDGYALIGTAVPHAIRNAGSTPARWFEILAPQPKPASALKDTYFTGAAAWPARAEAAADDLARPGLGRFKADKPIPAMGGGLQQGLTVFRFMEREFGAQCFFMMRGEMSVGGFRTRHDHPLEEFYMCISGEAKMEIEDQSFHLRAGDVAWTGVGTSHAFQQIGPEPFRWIETQTPQFPPKFGTRNYVEWEKQRAGR
jgi:mannose-6-phosphate isomerase-like protein (cupin superfamily)